MTKDLLSSLEQFKNTAFQTLEQCGSLDQLSDLKVKFLGKKGQLTEILKTLGQLSDAERKDVGLKANQVKELLNGAFSTTEVKLKRQAVDEQIARERVDIHLPALPDIKGSFHPVMQVFQDSKRIFLKLGFDVDEGPEIETDFYNFEALNIPPHHPARDMQDTFYFDDGRLLRTHTSPVQIHVMENRKPPLAMVAPGVVYRCDSDQTHTPMFHQIEALLVDKDVHFGHLKHVIAEYLQQIFERDLQFRFRPSFFPFTEPSAEVDMTCVFCDGKGCRVCKETGWLEIMGCGMVDPAVFKHVNIDSNVYSGFAFGAGLERIAMLKYRINDLRLFFENDLRFLTQF